MGARIVKDVVILFEEILGGSGRNYRLDFADSNFLDAGIGGERAGGNSGAESDSENRFRIGMKQRGEVADHALQFHVIRFSGGFDVTIHVHFNCAVIPSGDCDG